MNPNEQEILLDATIEGYNIRDAYDRLNGINEMLRKYITLSKANDNFTARVKYHLICLHRLTRLQAEFMQDIEDSIREFIQKD